jgi:hypothetical protein
MLVSPPPEIVTFTVGAFANATIGMKSNITRAANFEKMQIAFLITTSAMRSEGFSIARLAAGPPASTRSVTPLRRVEKSKYLHPSCAPLSTFGTHLESHNN